MIMTEFINNFFSLFSKIINLLFNLQIMTGITFGSIILASLLLWVISILWIRR